MAGGDARTLNRYGRIAAFLMRNYPETLEPECRFAAGSAVMLELMKLHEISADYAQSETQNTIEGRWSVRELRGQVESYRATLASVNAAPAQSSHQKAATFSRKTIELIQRNPDTLGLKDLISVDASAARSPLSPRLVAHCHSRDVAVDIKAPDVNAARSVAAAAANYSTRIAVLLLRYESVIVVMPEKARQYAVATVKLLQEWVREPLVIQENVRIALASEDVLTYLSESNVPN